MIGRNSLWLPFTLLLFLAGISFWLNYTVQGPGSGNARHDSDPEAIVENFEAVRTDPQGRIKERLSGRKLTHFSGSKLSELEAPHLVQISPTVANMTAVSEHATISHDSNEVSMENNVRVTRAGATPESALTLTTQHLLVYPDQDLLRAPGRVDVKGPGLVLNAARMEVQSTRRIIKFSGRVKALYQNAKR
jgi:lipopolysaccharide export system protein LptC